MNTNIFKKLNLKPSFSSGVIEKTAFVLPCILLEITKRPSVKSKNKIQKLITDFNKKRKNEKNITLLILKDGTMRIASGGQSTSVFKKRGKLKLSDKKIMLKGIIKELGLFVDFAKENI